MEKWETNEKKYYDRSLEPLLKKYITRAQYGEMAIFLEDIFQRRAYEFDFSAEHIEKEVANFVNRVKTVEFVPKERMSSETTMGVYIPSETTIRLNQDFYLKQINNMSELTFGSKLLETLTHEVYHGITDIGSELGLMYFKNNAWRGAALNEVFTETAANRATMPRGAREAEQYRANTDGYPDITFVSNLLAASIGVSEKELLKGGVQNRAQLMEVIASKFPSGKSFNEANKLFEKIESSLDIIYNLRYSNKSQRTEQQKSAEEQMLGGALTTLYGTAFELASHQITSSNKEVNKEVLADATYRYSKMEKIMLDSVDLFEKWNVISPEVEQTIFRKTEKQRNDLANRVVGIDTVVREGYKIQNPRELESAKIHAKRGTLVEKANFLYKKYGINISKGTSLSVSSITDDMEYEDYVMKEDFDGGRQWNNKDAAIVMKKVFIEEMERKGVIRRPSAIELQDTEELPVIDKFEKTEEIPVVDDFDKTDEVSVVDDPDKTDTVPVIDDFDKTDTVSIVDEEKKGFFGKLKDSINIMVTRFKNRNQPKLNQGRETREGDNSEYYASLATKSVESSLEQYVVDREQLKPLSLKVEDINVGKESINEKEMQDDDGR